MNTVKHSFFLALITLLVSVSPVAARPAVDLSSALAAYWHFEETSGTRADAIGSNDLSETGTVGYAAGVQGNAASLSDGLALSVTDEAAFGGDGSFTFTVWVYIESLPGVGENPIIASLGNTPEAYRWLLFEDGPSLIFEVVGSTTTADVISGVELEEGAWYLVSAWYDADSQTLGIDVNGSPETQSWVDGLAEVGTVPITFNWADADISFQGRMDEAAYWTRALTSDERAALYNSGTGCESVLTCETESPSPQFNFDLSLLLSFASLFFNALIPVIGLSGGIALGVGLAGKTLMAIRSVF